MKSFQDNNIILEVYTHFGKNLGKDRKDLEQFQTAVKQALKRHNITVYRLSEITGIERTHLLKIINGQRTVTPQKLDAILKAIDPTEDENEEIRLAYIDMNFGLEKFNNYTELFISNKKSGEKSGSDSDGVEISVEFTEPVTRFASRNELIKSLYTVTAYETANAENKRIYTNIDESITRDIFDSLPKNRGDYDIKQIISARSGSDYSKTVKTSVEFMLKGYKIYYSRANSDIEKRRDIIFPYYYVTDELCLFASGDLSCGFVAKNRRFADIYAGQILSAIEGMTSIVSISQNIMDVKNNLMKVIPYTEKTSYTIESDLCITFFMTIDMWDQIAKPDVPNRNFLRDTTYEYYQAIKKAQKSTLVIHSYEGTQKFTNDGIVFQMPAEYADPLTVENRAKIYKSMIEYYSDDSHDFRLSKEGVFSNKIAVDITDKYSDRKHVISYLYSYLTNFTGNANISIDDTDINNELIDFMNYLIASPYFYSKEESLNLLKEEMTKLEYKIRESTENK